jgi:beta-glucanase (GH16 family)
MPLFDNDFTGREWKLVWADDFDRNGLPDSKNWGYELGKVRNNELQFYTNRPENARVEKGQLIIEGRHERFQGSDYTAASLITLGKQSWQYGRFVIRAKLPRARGTWPAIWMMGDDIEKVGWPRCGEIDVMEHVAHTPGTIYGTLHQADANGKHVSKGESLRVPDCMDTFHIYALEWYPDHLDLFVDDHKYLTYAKDGKGPWTFDKKYYLLMNLAIGGDWGGQKGVDAAAFPQQYIIDYVRVYQKRT